MKKLLLTLLSPLILFATPKALHITFHGGCDKEIEYVCSQLGIDVTTWNIVKQKSNILEGKGPIKDCYNMTHERAKNIFKRHEREFHKYDIIITSDIAPLARIFLQHNWKKPLIIWVCNRFDINPIRTGYKKFPDQEYYDLFKGAKNLPNVEVIGYCNYEGFYAKKYRGVDTISQTIEPTGKGESLVKFSPVPKRINKEQTFFVRNYRNERLTKIHKGLKNLNIPFYKGPYAGSKDLQGFKGMIHIPLVMGNFHLWENMSNGLIHFIPSKKLYKRWYESNFIEFWDWISPSKQSTKINIKEIFAYSDWYDDRLAPFFVFFDSIEELQELTKNTNFEEKRAAMHAFMEQHTAQNLEAWRDVFGKFIEVQ